MLAKLNRKGGEQEHSIFYTIFTSIMIMISIPILIILAANLKPDIQYNTFNLRYNAMVSRLVYSPKCLAIQEQYDSLLGEKHYLTRPGIISVEKLDEFDKSDGKCLTGITQGSDYNFAVAKLNVSEPPGGDAVYSLNYTYNSASTCDPADWKRTDSYLITIQKRGNYTKGKIDFCMDEIS